MWTFKVEFRLKFSNELRIKRRFTRPSFSLSFCLSRLNRTETWIHPKTSSNDPFSPHLNLSPHAFCSPCHFVFNHLWKLVITCNDLWSSAERGITDRMLVIRATEFACWPLQDLKAPCLHSLWGGVKIQAALLSIWFPARSNSSKDLSQMGIWLGATSLRLSGVFNLTAAPWVAVDNSCFISCSLWEKV